MKGNAKVLETLNHLLADELTAISQYMVHAEMCDNWGYHNIAEVTEKRNGFRVRIAVQGTKDVPVAVEINLRSGGKLEGCVPAPRVADAWILPSGYATYRAGSDAIRFGPGSAPNQYTQVHHAEPKLPGPSVYVTGYTPFDHALEFEWL